MRNPFIYLFYKTPFENLKKHSEKVRECAQLFSEAVSSHLNGKIKEFELLTDHVAKLARIGSRCHKAKYPRSFTQRGPHARGQVSVFHVPA